jgi:hypothetical protein
MARTISLIQKDIFDRIANDPNLVALNSTSKTAIYRLMIFVVSYAIWLLENIFDAHKAQIDDAIYNQKSGTPRWYRSMALAFQYGFGFTLIADEDRYNNTGATDQDIEDSKIIKYCSVKESIESSRLIVKVAGENGTQLRPLTTLELDSFEAYMQEIKYAGVKLLIVNNPADKLQLIMKVYRDPLIIDIAGNNIRTRGRTVEVAVRNYIKNLPFDGELVINDMIDYLRDVEGVSNVHVQAANASFKDLVANAYTPFVAIDVRTIPVAGYFEITDFNGVSYVV